MTSFLEKYFIKTNIWVALCFSGLLAFFQLSLYELNVYVLGIVFFGTVAIYNFTRIKNLRNLKDLFRENSTQVALTSIGILGALICLAVRGFELKTFLYLAVLALDRKSTRLNSSHVKISYAVFCLNKKIIVG